MILIDLYFDNKTFNSDKARNDYRLIIEKVIEHFGESLEHINNKCLIEYLNGPFTQYRKQVNNEIVEVNYAAKTVEKNINIVKQCH